MFLNKSLSENPAQGLRRSLSPCVSQPEISGWLLFFMGNILLIFDKTEYLPRITKVDMKKASLFLIFIALLCFACRSDDKPGQDGREAPLLEGDAGPGPEVTTIGFSRKDTILHYTLDVKYPAIREHEVFNSAVNASLKTAIDEFTDFIQNFQAEGRVMSSEFQLIRNTGRVVSILQVYEWAVPGTSTLQYRIHNVNYNPEIRELISLGSLFREGVGYQQWLKERLEEKARARFKVEVEFNDQDLQAFTIGQDHLEFYKVLYPELMDPEPKAFQVKFSEMGKKLK